jgi:DNA-binding protein H-NS
MAQQHLGGEARERMILWIKSRMAEFDIGIEQLEASIEADKVKILTPIYRDATGNSWDGQGEMPTWLKRAQNAGVSIDFFLDSPAERK